jgi:hypothetical protein
MNGIIKITKEVKKPKRNILKNFLIFLLLKKKIKKKGIEIIMLNLAEIATPKKNPE